MQKPTARIYYRKLLEETSIDAPWDLVRCKMRNLKINFLKASKWLKTAETELDENELIDKLKILCPNYELLKKMFGELDEKNNEEIFEVSFMSNQEDDSQSVEALDEDGDWYESILPSDSKSTINSERITKSTPNQDTVLTPKIASVSSLLQKTGKNSAISQLAAVQVGREAFYKSKLELEKEKFKKYCEFEERKLLLEEERIKNDFKIQEKKLKLEELKLQQNFELKKLQLEKHDKITMYENEIDFDTS